MFTSAKALTVIRPFIRQIEKKILIFLRFFPSMGANEETS